MVTHPSKKFGRKPTVYDKRTLRFRDYVPRLPPIPPSVDYSHTSYPMDGNNQYGDCVMAAIAHQIGQWTFFGQGTERIIAESDVIAKYLQLSPNDQGLEILSTLNLWRQGGFWGDKIDAFVSLDAGNSTQAKASIYFFGSVNIGLSLPDNNTFGPWDTVTGPPDQNNGHCVALVGYDATGFLAVTWGAILHMSYDWYVKYSGSAANGEAYAILSRDWLNTKGLDPDGFDYATLSRDLQEITGAPPPPQPPPPPPPPGPGCFGRIKHIFARAAGMPD